MTIQFTQNNMIIEILYKRSAKNSKDLDNKMTL